MSWKALYYSCYCYSYTTTATSIITIIVIISSILLIAGVPVSHSPRVPRDCDEDLGDYDEARPPEGDCQGLTLPCGRRPHRLQGVLGWCAAVCYLALLD